MLPIFNSRRPITICFDAIEKRCNREKVQVHKLIRWVNIDDLIDKVSTYYEVGSGRLLQRLSRNNEGRQVLLYMAGKYCRGRYTLGEIADKLNLGSWWS